MENETPEQPVADSVSVEDRVANLFDPPEQGTEPVEQAQETETASEAPVEETFEFDLGEKKYVLPKELEKAVLQEKDYTQKSQQLAEQRRSLELAQQQIKLHQMGEQFQQSVAPEAQRVQMLDAFLEEYKKLDWSSMTTDDLVRKRLEMDQYKEAREGLKSEIDKKRQEFDANVRDEYQKFLVQAKETISKRIPNFSDATLKEIRDHAASDGYTSAEMDSISDPRHVLTLWKAQQYDKLRTSAAPSVSQAKTAKPGTSNPMPQAVKDKLAFRKAISKAQPGSSEYKAMINDRVAKLFG